MKKIVLFTSLLLLSLQSIYGQGLWRPTTTERTDGLVKMERASTPIEFKLFNLNFDAFKNQLLLAPSDELSAFETSNVIAEFPDASGNLKHFRMYKSAILHPDLEAKFENIKTYIGVGVEDKSVTVHVSTTLFGLHAMVLSSNSNTVLIDTYTKDLQNYIVYEKNKLFTNNRNQNCLVQDESPELGAISNKALTNALASDGLLRTYRLAMACTIEYAAFHVNAAGLGSGTLAQKKAAVQAAMTVTMTRNNGVFLKDMSLRFQFVANNDLVIFVDSDTFDNANAGTLINQSQTVIDGAIGTANYDIGHTVSTGGGGLAQRPSVCVTGKARGITGSPSPVGDSFDIDFVAHEIGHQFGANHTFAGDAQNCSGTNRSNTTAVETGSGTTVMAYAGICSPQDVQSNSDDYFHAVSIAEMVAHITGSGNCVVGVSNSNAAPIIPIVPNFTIPNGTAFRLIAPATTDANGDVLTYCWEQNNGIFDSNSSPVSSATATTGATFRSYSPTTSTTRFFPKLSDILGGNLAPTWEKVPTVARTMNFALTVRDNRTPNGGQTSRRDNVVTFAAVGPFTITSPNVENVSWPLGSSQTVTWNVAGTTANGINTANVNILYSSDGGQTFPTVLAANTPNDGTQVITVPNTASTTGRIMIEAVGNIFLAISKNIAVGFSIVNSCNTYVDNTPLPFVDQPPGSFTTRTLNVPVSGTISDVNVVNRITHTYLSDVQTDISSPQNPTTFIKLFNRGCGNTNGTLNLLFNDGSAAINCLGGAASQSVAPAVALSAFNGQSPTGNWTFRVYDNFAGDAGTINNWSIEVCTSTTTLLNQDFGLENFSIYPNPNNGNFTIQFNSTSSNDVKVAVVDMRGRLVYNNSFQNSGLFNQNVQLNNLESGIYLVNVQDGNRKEIKKIIIE